ncbi:transcriptional regulator [Streptomyces sp. NBC_01433]|uniref:transcriptional regulator n=1 Tax=Streptomyces sp. NBC_01433 TaxID=2903864 RepID=UPI0022595B15|nr:transcriptional regulator [Streptomyces sp. NBC_01433]MCX4682608.1 transcriptional regulator [Streptomyces sp. NBC_01433]
MFSHASHTDTIATFAAVFVTLWVAHTVGDHWLQTAVQSAQKGQHDRNPGESSRVGRLACTRHLIGLTLTKALLLALSAIVLDLSLTVAGVAIGLGLDAASHWWADRRSSLAWLAGVAESVGITGKTEFYNLGTGAHPFHPVTAEGKPAGHIGTGAYALDQAFHAFFLFLAALIIAAV